MLKFPDITSSPKKDYSNPNILPLLFKAAEKINHDYYNNREMYFKNIKTPIDNVRVDSKDIDILNDTKKNIVDQMTPIIKDNAFHKAGEVIFNIQSSLSANQSLKMAQSDYNARIAGEKEIDEGDTKDWSPEYRAAMKRMRVLNSRSVYTDENGQVQSGYANLQFSKYFDFKDLKAALSSVDNDSNYGVSSSSTERLVNVDSELQKALGKGIEDLTDDQGNKPFFGSATTKFKHLDKNRVFKAVYNELSRNKEYVASLSQEADLSLFMAQEAKTANIKGKAVKNINEFVKFDIGDVFDHYSKNANEQNYIQQLIEQSPEYKKQVSVNGKLNGKQDPTKVAMFAANYYQSLVDKGVDLDAYFRGIVKRDHISNTISGIADDTAGRLTYVESAYSLTLHKNPNFDKTLDANGNKKSATPQGQMVVSDTMALTESPEQLAANGANTALLRKNANLNTINLQEQVAAMQAPVIAKNLEGLTETDRAFIKEFRKKGLNASHLKKEWTNPNISVEEAFAKYEKTYDVNGDLARTAFDTDEAYNKYVEVRNKRDISANNEQHIKDMEDSLYMKNAPAVNAFIDQYISDVQLFNTNVKPNEFARVVYESIGEKSYFELLKATGINSTSAINRGNKNSGNIVDRYMSTENKYNQADTRNIRKFIRENPNNPIVKQLKTELARRAPEWTEYDDITENYRKDHPEAVSNLTYKTITNAPKNYMDIVIASLKDGSEKQVIWSSNPNYLTEFGTMNTDDVLKDSNGNMLLDIQSGSNKNLTVLPIALGDNTTACKIINHLTGETAIVRLATASTERDRGVRALLNSSLTCGNRELSYQRSEKTIEGLTFSMPVQAGDKTFTIKDFSDSIYKTMPLGSTADITTYMPDAYIGGSGIPIGITITRQNDGRFSVSLSNKDNLDMTPEMNKYVSEQTKHLNSILTGESVIDGEITYDPMSFNSLQDIINYTAHEIMYNTKNNN